jgi:hypothetical protein
MNLNFSCIESTTPNNTQRNRTWTNAPTQQCYVVSTQAYWIDHKHIYFAFELLDYFPKFTLPSSHQTSKNKNI